YLVVAADKGTAALSDVAHEISLAHGFWLGDAFASGGSSGYDHKRIGITARGAWEAVRRHFRELGIDIQRSAIAVIGIGDMSGDVFGNGMLLSRNLRLIGAFNHEHVFLDPDPDTEASFAERARLAALAQSGWGDYDAAAISVGGGVWARASKSIPLSPEVRAVLGVDDEALPPDAVIRALLQAPVDLLWNGGIGTYVKASTESQTDVGDKTNDGVRVNGSELRCRVVGEGGNLGFTQRGRIEYAIAGGRINTDAIDNVGGVNCSDREVNIKILLDGVVSSGELTVEQRDALLAEMTDGVTAQVLADSYSQTQALSIAVSHADELLEVHARLIRNLEATAGLDRALEFLPTEEEIGERRVHERGLTSPELAVLLSYAKIALHAALQASELPDDQYLDAELISYFPPMLAPRFPGEMRRHPLRREIIATHLSNDFVDHAGMSAAFSLGEETGATQADLARGYTVAREVFEMRTFWQAVKALDDVAESATQTAMLQEGRKLIERSTRWLVRNRPSPLELAASIERFTPGAGALAAALPTVLDDPDREAFETLVEQLEQGGASRALAARAAGMGVAYAAFDVVEIAEATSRPLAVVIEAYFRAGSRFSLSWLRDRIVELPRANQWQALARASLRDDVSTLQRSLTIHVLLLAPPGASVEE
ncbi:MAG: NAD-glutamate dehydrogenase domain-containing protein, partial [Solirubrobacteraceae bacterium]